ncbi:hypothetical protein EON65_54160, partial [archaeon]
MNPFLGSTQEFNKFIQSGLPASRTVTNDRYGSSKPRSSSGSRNTSNRPLTSSATAAAIKPGQHIDSQDFVISNTIKYIDSSNKPRRVSSAGTNGGTRGGKSASNPVNPEQYTDAPAFNFVHSWKAHLDRKPSPSIDARKPVSTIISKVSSRMVRGRDEEEGVGERDDRLKREEDTSPLSPMRLRDLHIVHSPFQGVRRAALLPSSHTLSPSAT